MAVTHLALLLAAAMSSCCAWHLPALPAQHRAQYYVLHDDGAYKHGFDTGEGQWASAKADASNQVTGEWQAVDNAGQAVHWAYTAGVQGYVPVLGKAAGGSAPAHVVPIVATAKHVPVAPPAWQAPPVQTKHSVDSQAGTGDASYKFQYVADDHSRQESSDAKGSVVGSFQFKADDGVERRVDYVAGKDTGFIAKGDHLPVAPEVPAVPQVHVAPQAKSWSSQTKQSSWSATLPVPHVPVVPVVPQPKSWSHQSSWSSSSSTGHGPASTASSAHSKAAASSQESVINPNGGYKFHYVAEDHSRQESSDASGKVQGSFQFKATDGVQRRVDYVAGKETGFVAKGDHLPVAPEVPAVPAPHIPVAPQVKSWTSQAKQSSWSATPTVGHVPVVSTHLQAPKWTDASARGDINADSEGSKAFSYSYDAVLSAKQETSDEQGNVAGSFQFVDGAGQQRSLTYTVNGDEGFIAKGDHLPVAPEVPVVPALPVPYVAIDPVPFVHVAPVPHVPVAPAPKTWTNQASWTSSSGNAAVSSHSKAAASSQDAVINPDGSHSFHYVAEDHSRQESSDASGNVVGNYQFKADDGVQRRVDYVAGSNTGFVAKGDHLPVAPEVPAVPQVHVAPQAKSWSSQTKQSSWSATLPVPHVPVVPVAPAPKSWSHQASWSSSSSGNVPVSTHSKAAASSQDAVINPDGSHSFHYVAEDHSRQESSDASGNVVGNYQFKADDGVQRRVDYVAGRNTGFVAKGDHLPVAPEVPAVPAPHVPVAPQAKSWSNQASWSSAGSNAGGWSRQDEQVQGEVEQQEETSEVEDQQQAIEDEKVQKEDEAQRLKDEAIAQVDEQALAAENQANQQLLLQQEEELKAQAALAQADTEQAQAQAENQDAQDRLEQSKYEAERNAELEGLKQEEEQLKLQEQQEEQVQQVQQVQQKSLIASSGAKSDGYSFSYNTDTQSVQQQVGAGNSAQGSYSFVAPDDQQWRQVDWTAAAGTGFVAKGNHLPVAPLPQVPVAPVPWTSSHAASKSSTTGVKTSSHSVQTSHDDQDNGDGSYEYSYKTDSASKQESAGKDGSVTGTFSYQGPDGVLRRLDYTANDRDGFLAKGDHLPGSSSSSGGHVSSWTTDARAASSGSHGSSGAWSTKTSSTSSGAKSAHVSTGSSGGHASLGSWGLKTAHGDVQSSHGSAGSRPYAPLPVVKSPVVKHFPEVEVTRYLPPESPKKYGYAFEAKH